MLQMLLILAAVNSHTQSQIFHFNWHFTQGRRTVGQPIQIHILDILDGKWPLG